MSNLKNQAKLVVVGSPIVNMVTQPQIFFMSDGVTPLESVAPPAPVATFDNNGTPCLTWIHTTLNQSGQTLVIGNDPFYYVGISGIAYLQNWVMARVLDLNNNELVRLDAKLQNFGDSIQIVDPSQPQSIGVAGFFLDSGYGDRTKIGNIYTLLPVPNLLSGTYTFELTQDPSNARGQKEIATIPFEYSLIRGNPVVTNVATFSPSKGKKK